MLCQSNLMVKALPRNASSKILSPRQSNEQSSMVDMPIKMAIEELRQRLADECEERICGQRRPPFKEST
eukprot:symbB.v1.2.007043.t1/scaffold414.1/size398445/7